MYFLDAFIASIAPPASSTCAPWRATSMTSAKVVPDVESVTVLIDLEAISPHLFY